MELAQLFSNGLVNFESPGAAGTIRSVLFAPPLTWEDVTERILAEKRPLWEALAAQ